MVLQTHLWRRQVEGLSSLGAQEKAEGQAGSEGGRAVQAAGGMKRNYSGAQGHSEARPTGKCLLK